MIRHLLIAYHTCPMEEPGVGLAGGMNTFLRGLLRGLGAHGVETLVLTRGKGAAPEETRPFPGVSVLHAPCGWTQPPTRESAFRSLPAFADASDRLLGKGARRFDVVSAHYWMSGVAARRIAGARGLPLMVAYHTVEARKRAAAEGPPSALSVRRSAAEEELSRAAFRIVFFTQDDLRATAAFLPEAGRAGTVIPAGVDEAFRNPPPRREARTALGLPEGPFLFLLAARPDPGKNVEAAVAAFRALRAEGAEDARLFVAGQAAPPGPAIDGVSWGGAIPHRGMPAVYAAAEAVLCPSAYESFGLVPLEALASGVPVVVPEDGFWGRKVRAEGGGLTYAGPPAEGLRHAMRKLLVDPGLRARLAREARGLSAPFTWATCRESWARLLSTGATRGNPP